VATIEAHEKINGHCPFAFDLAEYSSRMVTKRTDNSVAHELSLAEILQTTRSLSAQRFALTLEAGEIYAAHKGSAPDAPPFDDHARAVRTEIAQLLNGSTPAEMLLPPAVQREDQIEIKREAIDQVLRVLHRKELVARQREAERWVAEHTDQWRALCKETMLAAEWLATLEQRARDMAGEVIELAGGPVSGLAMARYIGAGSSILGVGDPLMDMRNAAIEEGICTQRDIEMARR
jgi:hypothetical protein